MRCRHQNVVYFQLNFEQFTIWDLFFKKFLLEIGKYAKLKISWHVCLAYYSIYVGLKMNLPVAGGIVGF